MIRKQNLQKAVLLGLLTASISVPVFAKDINEQIVDNKYNNTYTEDINIQFENPQNYMQGAIDLNDGKSV